MAFDRPGPTGTVQVELFQAICFPEIRTAIRVHTFSSHIVTSVA